MKDPNTEEHAVAAEERAGSAEKELIALLLTTGACINNSQFHIPIQIVMDFGKANQYEYNSIASLVQETRLSS